MTLWVYQGHPCCQGSPCPPCLRSGTINVLQVPPLLDPPLPDTLLIEISIRNFQGMFLGGKNIIHDFMDEPVLHVSDQEPSTSSEYPLLEPPILDTLIIEISTRNFQGIFLGVNKHIS